MQNNSISSFISQLEQFVPSISMDCVVFGYKDHTLHVLLLKYRDTEAWTLPGGFLNRKSTMDKSISQILKDRTGISGIFLDQVNTSSDLDRGWNSNKLSQDTLKTLMKHWPEDQRKRLSEWFGSRFITTSFVALVNANKVKPMPDDMSSECSWVELSELPPLVLDHGKIIEKALIHLRTKMNYLPIGRELLEEKFTMGELQSLYEAVLDKKFERSNFQRKMIKLNFLDRHEKRMDGAQNRAPYLYSINETAYERLLEDGIGFI